MKRKLLREIHGDIFFSGIEAKYSGALGGIIKPAPRSARRECNTGKDIMCVTISRNYRTVKMKSKSLGVEVGRKDKA